jgi:hypothetical protein
MVLMELARYESGLNAGHAGKGEDDAMTGAVTTRRLEGVLRIGPGPRDCLRYRQLDESCEEGIHRITRRTLVVLGLPLPTLIPFPIVSLSGDRTAGVEDGGLLGLG